MRSMTAKTVALLSLWLLLVPLAGQAESSQAPAADQSAADHPYAAQKLEVGDGVVLAGQIDMQQLAERASRVMVIDLRTAAEGTASAAEQAQTLGIDYHNVPVAGAVVDPARLDELQAAIDARQDDELLVIHCASGNRAGMMWGALAVRHGAEVESVKKTLAPILNKPPAIEALEKFAAGGADEPD